MVLAARADVEPGRGLVEQHQLRFARKRHDERELDLCAEGERRDLLPALELELLHQALAARGIPIGIEAAHEIDGAPDRAPGLVAHLGADIGGAPLDLDLIVREVPAENADLTAIGLSHPHEEIERRSLAGAVGADQGRDDAARHVEGERAQHEVTLALVQMIEFDSSDCHECSPQSNSSSWRSSCTNSFLPSPASRPSAMA